MTLFGVSQRDVSLEAADSVNSPRQLGRPARPLQRRDGRHLLGRPRRRYNATTRTTTYTAQIKRRLHGVWTVL